MEANRLSISVRRARFRASEAVSTLRSSPRARSVPGSEGRIAAAWRWAAGTGAILFTAPTMAATSLL